MQSYCSNGKTCWERNTKNGLRTNTPYCCFGFLIDLLKRLEKDLNFQSYVYLVEDRSYGSQHDGIWNGMIGDLVYGKADLALAILSVNKERSKFVDFSVPFKDESIGIATLKKAKPITFLNIDNFSSFQPHLWVAIVLVVFFSSILLYFVENRFSCLRTYTWVESINYLTGLLFQRDIGGENPKHSGSRMIAISIAMATTILMSTYVAMLTANLVGTETQKAISGLLDEKVKRLFVVAQV